MIGTSETSDFAKMMKYTRDPCSEVWIERIHDATNYSYQQILNMVHTAKVNHKLRWGNNWGWRRPIAHVADILRVNLPSVGFNEKGNIVVVWYESTGSDS